MKITKGQRIAAIIGIVLLVLLYLAAFISAFIHHPLASSILQAALFGTIIIPVLLYAFLLSVRHFRPRDDDKEDSAPSKHD